jgi:hypothetical protein
MGSEDNSHSSSSTSETFKVVIMVVLSDFELDRIYARRLVVQTAYAMLLGSLRLFDGPVINGDWMGCIDWAIERRHSRCIGGYIRSQPQKTLVKGRVQSDASI